MVGLSGKGDLARYARHLALEGWDQNVITSSHVVIVGVGALGCEIAKNLTLVGCGKLTLIDMDIIETSNLSRQMLFTEEDRGKLKAEVAAEKLAALNPDVEIAVYCEKFQELPLGIFEDADVIAGGLDSFKARFALNRMAYELCKPYVDGAATGFKGNVQIIVPEGCDITPEATACLKCFFPVPPTDEKIFVACSIPGEPRSREQCILKAEDRFVKEHGVHTKYSSDDLIAIAEIASELSETSPHTEKESFIPEEVENIIENKIPSILTVNAVISGIVSHEVLKILHRLKGRNIGEIMVPPYLEYSSAYGIFTPVEIARDANCSVCRKGRVKMRLSLKEDSTMDELLSTLADSGYELPQTVLITNVIDARVIMAPGQDVSDKKISDLNVHNHDILRATYASMGEDGVRERKQLEFIVDMGGEK